jgi:hypothetical protein
MKIKLLIAPSIVVLIIVLLIWQVYPAINEPVMRDGVLQKSAELKSERKNLETIKGKSDKVHELAVQLNSSAMASEKALVMDFLPENIDEYKIIDNLNYLVLKEELQGLAISVAQPSGVASLPVQADTVDAASGQAVTASPALTATTFTVSFSVQGSYEKIKSIFQKIYGLKRFNRLLSFRLEPVENKGGEGSSNLKATSFLEFAFSKESGTFTSADDISLSKTDFDQEAISSISKKKETPLLPEIQIEKNQRTNPFIP